MPKYLIERQVEHAGKMNADQLRALSQQSNGVLTQVRDDGHNIQWLQSYVTDDTIHCVYIAENREAILEHARCGGFPANNIMEVRTLIDPSTGE